MYRMHDMYRSIGKAAKMASNSLLRAKRVFMLAPRLIGGRTLMPCCSRTPYLSLMSSTKLHTSSVRRSEQGGMMESTHWNLERGLTVALVGIIPAAMLTHYAPLDVAMSAAIVLHGHWGMEQIFTDYVHGNTLPKVVHGILFAVSCLAFAGFCSFNYNDVGLSKAICMLWS